MPKENKLIPADTIDPSIITFEGILELDLDLLDTFSQEETISLTENFQPVPLMEDSSRDSDKENEDAIALALDQQEIPEDWNFIFIAMQANSLQALHSKIQATIPQNQIAYNHLFTVWHIDLGATSHICAHRSMFEEYTKVEQTSAVWTRAGPIKAIGTGTVRITLVCSNGATTVILLKGILHLSGFLTNLVSVSRLWKKRVY